MPAPEPKPVAEPKADVPVKSEPTSAASAAAPVPAKPGAQTSAAPTVKPADKPAEMLTAPEKKAEPAEKPVSKTVADAKAAPDASGQWVIQLGAYKEAGNVKLLLAKLKGVGVPAYTEKIDSPQGPRTRVRAGPFASQEAAEKARTRVKIIGVDGPVAQQ
jgi:DedD protein